MKIAVITNSSSYMPRVEMVADFFEKKGLDVTIFKSDFLHREKMKKRETIENTIYIDTIPYYRNLSFRRLYSHYMFAKKVYEILQSKSFDLVYVLIPANSLMKFAALYKKNNNIKLIVDIIDLWPESLPLRFLKEVWPITVWADLRNKHLKEADLIITECNLYKKVLKDYLGDTKTVVIYWTKEYATKIPQQINEKDNKMHFCYLGSINNIIDIKFMVRLLTEVKKDKDVLLHIIGDGEKKQDLLEELEKLEIQHIYYGPIYNEHEKMQILTNCDYGLNIMKNTVCVGLTMKSVDYMYAGLPIVNNIKGDTWDLIEKNRIGFNCENQSLAIVAKQLIENNKEMASKKQLIHKCYSSMFSKESYNQLMEECIEQLIDNI